MSPADDPRGPTEPLPARGGTQPMPPGQRPRSQARDRRLWIVAGVLALVLVAFAGFLVGRSQAPGKQATQAKPAAVGGPRRACARALEFAAARYSVRLGQAMPLTARYITERLRPSGLSYFIAWQTLTHAENSAP